MRHDPSGSTTPFNGPLFIVGMPRSGTKLLRAIISAHPRVRIPKIETEFLPYWVRNWEKFGTLSEWEEFQRFHASCRSLPFFVYLDEGNDDVDALSWYRRCKSFTPASVFEALLRTHLEIESDEVIWGDKSPSYIGHMQLLKQLYPEARFIHIVRDVRDYCLSIRKAWRKNMLRAAQRWADDVSSARMIGSALGDDYFEVRYEDLLEDPSGAAREVCAFLGVEFYEDLLNLARPVENLGEAKDAAGILKHNAGRFRTGLNDRQRRRIEAVAGKTLKELGYPCDHSGPSVRVGKARLRFLQAIDGANLLLFSARERGIAGALKFVSQYFVVSGNRQKPGL